VCVHNSVCGFCPGQRSGHVPGSIRCPKLVRTRLSVGQGSHIKIIFFVRTFFDSDNDRTSENNWIFLFLFFHKFPGQTHSENLGERCLRTETIHQKSFGHQFSGQEPGILSERCPTRSIRTKTTHTNIVLDGNYHHIFLQYTV
jgi:hypothetical protein